MRELGTYWWLFCWWHNDSGWNEGDRWTRDYPPPFLGFELKVARRERLLAYKKTGVKDNMQMLLENWMRFFEGLKSVRGIYPRGREVHVGFNAMCLSDFIHNFYNRTAVLISQITDQQIFLWGSRFSVFHYLYLFVKILSTEEQKGGAAPLLKRVSSE